MVSPEESPTVFRPVTVVAPWCSMRHAASLSRAVAAPSPGILSRTFDAAGGHSAHVSAVLRNSGVTLTLTSVAASAYLPACLIGLLLRVPTRPSAARTT
eukprot:294226-Chlamydomonas_euryale.AAC.1